MRTVQEVLAAYHIDPGDASDLANDLGIPLDTDLDTHVFVPAPKPVGCETCKRWGTPGRWPDGDVCAYCGDPGTPVFLDPVLADALPALLRVALGVSRGFPPSGSVEWWAMVNTLRGIPSEAWDVLAREHANA